MSETLEITRTHPFRISRSPEVAKLAKGAGITLAGKLTGRFVHTLGQIAIARLLGPESFGLYAIGWTLLNMIGLISPLGLDHGVIRYASRYWRTNSSKLNGVLLQSLSLAVLSGAVIGSCLYLLAPWLAERVFQKPDLTLVIRGFSPAFALLAGLRVAAATTRVSQRMQYSVYAQDLAQPVSNLLLVLVFYLLGWRLIGAVAAGVSSFAIALFLALRYVKRLFPQAFARQNQSTLVAGELLAFSLPATFAGIFANFTNRVDRLLVGYFRPAAEVGIYQAVSQSAILFATVMGAFNAIFSPVIAELYHKQEIRRIGELFKVSTKWGLYLSLPLFLTMSFAPRESLSVIFGPRYESGYAALVVLSVAQLVNVGTGAVGPLLVMTGHQKKWFVISGMMLAANIALNLLLVPRFGLLGAALGSVCAVVGLFSLGLYQVKRLLGIWPYDRRYFKGVLATALAVGALFLLRAFELDSPALSLFLTATVSTGVFVAALILSGLDAEDREFIGLIRSRLRKRI
jgi:O-antigen/teichoic acid export membrane protein